MQVGFPVASCKENISNPAHFKLNGRKVKYNFIGSVISTVRGYASRSELTTWSTYRRY